MFLTLTRILFHRWDKVSPLRDEHPGTNGQQFNFKILLSLDKNSYMWIRKIVKWINDYRSAWFWLLSQIRRSSLGNLQTYPLALMWALAWNYHRQLSFRTRLRAKKYPSRDNNLQVDKIDWCLTKASLFHCIEVKPLLIKQFTAPQRKK